MNLSFNKIGTGYPLIILHGLYGSKDNWLSIGKLLAIKFTVYLIDQRNHGESPHSEELNYEVMSKDLFQFYIDNKIEKASIIGHSMGGKTALFFAKNHPHKIDKIIVIDISPLSYNSTFKHKQNLDFHLAILNCLSTIDLSGLKSRSEADEMLQVSIKSKKIRQFLLKNLKRNSDKSFSWKLNINSIKSHVNEVFDGFNPDEKIEIKTPTLFIKGEKSDYIDKEDILYIKRTFNFYKLAEIKSAGHWIHSEQPEILIEIILNFMQM